MHSNSHRKALVKALAKMNVQTIATPEAMVAKVTENKQGVITFSDEDLPVKGRNHNRVLFILAKVRGKRTSYMMVNDRPAINVCSLQIRYNLEVKVLPGDIHLEEIMPIDGFELLGRKET